MNWCHINKIVFVTLCDHSDEWEKGEKALGSQRWFTFFCLVLYVVVVFVKNTPHTSIGHHHLLVVSSTAAFCCFSCSHWPYEPDPSTASCSPALHPSNLSVYWTDPRKQNTEVRGHCGMGSFCCWEPNQQPSVSLSNSIKWSPALFFCCLDILMHQTWIWNLWGIDLLAAMTYKRNKGAPNITDVMVWSFIW